MTIKLGILGSTRGTAMQAVIDAIDKGRLDACIKVVVSHKPDVGILARAKEHGLRAECIELVGLSREEVDQRISLMLQACNVDLVLLIGYMRILSPVFVKTWHRKAINIHPSLLPKHVGLMDRAVHQAVLDAGEQETGCTLHYVEDVVDGGEIILQKKCVVEADDTVDTLKHKVQALEKVAFVEAIKNLEEYHVK